MWTPHNILTIGIPLGSLLRNLLNTLLSSLDVSHSPHFLITFFILLSWGLPLSPFPTLDRIIPMKTLCYKVLQCSYVLLNQCQLLIVIRYAHLPLSPHIYMYMCWLSGSWPRIKVIFPNKSLHYWPVHHQPVEGGLKSQLKQYGGMLEPSLCTHRWAWFHFMP